MATATAPGMVHERNRWRTMSTRRLFSRLQQITKPDKLACFLNVASEASRGTLYRDGIDRCNALGYGAIETSPNWFSVVRSPAPSRIIRQFDDGTEFLGDPNDDDIRPEMGEDGGMIIPDHIAEAIANTRVVGTVHDDLIIEKEPEVPKKKNLYSRKLRTKRR